MLAGNPADDAERGPADNAGDSDDCHASADIPETILPDANVSTSQSREEMEAGMAFTQIIDANPGLASLLPEAIHVPDRTLELASKVGILGLVSGKVTAVTANLCVCNT